MHNSSLACHLSMDVEAKLRVFLHHLSRFRCPTLRRHTLGEVKYMSTWPLSNYYFCYQLHTSCSHSRPSIHSVHCIGRPSLSFFIYKMGIACEAGCGRWFTSVSSMNSHLSKARSCAWYEKGKLRDLGLDDADDDADDIY